MLELLITILVALLVVAVAIWALRAVVAALHGPPIIVTLGTVVIVIIAMIWILRLVPGLEGID